MDNFSKQRTRRVGPGGLNWHAMAVEEVIEALDVKKSDGLADEAVGTRLAEHGANRLAEQPPKPPWRLFLEQFKSLLILILVVAAVLAGAIGDLKDTLVILAVVLINAVLGFYQEYRAERSLAALKEMLAPEAEVRRGGHVRVVPAADLVPGDIVLLDSGDRVPADGRLIESHRLEVDESSLTGESQPVGKDCTVLHPPDTLLADQSNMLYMNTTVTRGRAEMVVTATGMATEIGRLAQMLAEARPEPTPLQIQLDNLGKRVALVAVLVVAVMFAGAMVRAEPLARAIMTSIALAVAAIPEGLPAVVTVTLAIGLRRMARQQAIVKRLAAVETLGCTTVICTDKTGTLTVNQMTARALWYKRKRFSVSGEGYNPVGEIRPEHGGACPDLKPMTVPLALCNDSNLHDGSITGDPMEAALLTMAVKDGARRELLEDRLPRVAEIPFDAAHKFMATFHRDGERIHIYVKGAPEVLLKRCATVMDSDGEPPLTVEARMAIENENETLAARGLRVLCVASRSLRPGEFDPAADLFNYVEGLTFIGLVGLMDPPRAEARDAVALCRQAGIAVKMITGDHKITAAVIARELGIEGETLSADELEGLNEDALLNRIEDVSVFARVTPEQKVRIVLALKNCGHIVAMTGDGVNDAPALKSADIGVAMGVTGTDVAREAADMVLTDDNFATIVRAVKEGRTIYNNIVKFVRFQLSTNFGAMLAVFTAPLIDLPVPLNPIQILWVNIIMDGPPAMALGVDPPKPGIMGKPPREPGARILNLRRLGNLAAYGVTMAVGTLGVLYYGLHTGTPERALTLAFTTFVLFQVFNVFNARNETGTVFNRNFFTNIYLWLALAGVVGLQILAVHWPPAQAVFNTAALSAIDWMIAIGTAASVLVLEEARKLTRLIRRRGKVKNC